MKELGECLRKENSICSKFLLLEDSQGGRSVFPGGLTAMWKEKNLQPRIDGKLRLSQDILESEKAQGAFRGCLKDGDRANLRLARLQRAQKALSSLQDRYEKVLNQEVDITFCQGISHQVFFNSHLIYLIATTDDNEDNVGHSQFVASYALLLAKAMGIEDEKFLLDLERGALFHDIGKIGLPSAILCKPGYLTPLEREIVKEHPFLGYLLLQDYPFFQEATEVVLYHHEWYNGKGYPFGLKREEIPLAARIFSLADTLDAITSDRPYRRGQSFEVATYEIARGSGSQFDSAIVDVFLSVPKERWAQALSEALRLFHLPSIN